MKYAAELVGTFVLVFVGLGTAVFGGATIAIALAFGISLMAMAYALGPVSGCHINPAVSLGMYLSKRMSLRDMGLYWAAQVAGAILACALLLVIAHDAPGNYNAAATGFAANGYGVEHSPGHYGATAAFLTEAILTMVLVLTVLGSTDNRAPAGFAGIPIGLTLSALILAGIQVTNASINPARSIGPAIFVGGWAMEQIWLFIVAPMVGAVVAALLYRSIKPVKS